MISVLLVLSSFAALAETQTPTNNLAVDSEISVSGLKQGDSVTFYRVLKFSEDATTTGGWVNDTGFSLTDDQIRKALFIKVENDKYTQVEFTAENMATYGIDEELAGKIADMAETSGVNYTKYTVTAGSDGKAKQDSPEEGLYVAIITPFTAGEFYNPVFVGADYKNDNNTNNWTVDLNDSYQPASMAKKDTIDLDKSITGQTNNRDEKVQTVNVGDTVSFLVKTTIPEFNDSYTEAVFKITDQLTKGLDLQTGTIKVYKGSTTADAVEANLLTAAATYSDNVAYKLTTTEASVTSTPATSNQANGDGYVVDFYTQYLLGLNAEQPIIITYDAVVLDTAVSSVNIEDNTVTLNFSNNPTDNTGRGILKDETKNYTFDIDASLFGEDAWKSYELVKIGLDKNGNEIQGVTNVHQGQSYGALQGAKFKLYVAKTDGTTTIKDDNGADLKVTPYTSSIYDANTEFVSDAEGRITVSGAAKPGIRGLDAGTYYLVETDAPDGYIKAQKAVKIVIDATLEDVDHHLYYDKVTGATSTTQNQEGTLTDVKWTVPELKSYTITINGKQTASYTMINEKPSKGDTVIGAHGSYETVSTDNLADAGKIPNTQGVELPSTGGMGTTILYIGGSILVILAAVLLITKRRMNAED